MDRALEIARFTLRSGRCGLCGGDQLTPVEAGYRCECGAISLTSKLRPVDHEREALTREDADHLLDLQAADRSSGYRDRSFGG